MRKTFRRIRGDSTAEKRRRRRVRLGAVGAVLAAALVGFNLASAVNVGGFEIDASDSPADQALYAGTESPAGDDWADKNVAAAGDGVFTNSTGSPHTAATDCYGSDIDKVLEPSTLICDGNSDNVFKTDDPEMNIVSPSGKTPDDVWPVKPGNVRPKNDFSHAYVHADTADSPCDPDALPNNTMLHLGGHVGDNEGSHFWGFEFNENAPVNFDKLKANGALGTNFDLDFNRQVGDLLISITVPGNADPVQLVVFEVTAVDPVTGEATFAPAVPIAACPAGTDGNTELATNQTNNVEAPPWNVPVCDPTPPESNSNQCRAANGLTGPFELLAPRDFAEASIDLTAFGINPCFTNVIFTSRSAHPLEGADIQDVGGGDFPLCGKKSGVKFHDRNADGVRAATGEEGLNGWTMKLYSDDGDKILEAGELPALATTTTSTINSVVGSYEFGNLANGNYIVCEVLQANWFQSRPSSGTDVADCTSQSGDSTLGAKGYAFTMSGADHPGNDFGNFQNGTVSGMKFKDADAGGDKDTGETGLGGWIIHLFGTSAQGAAIHRHETTAANGTYSFTGLAPGSYTVCEQLTGQSGWFQSFPTAPAGTACTSPHDNLTPPPATVTLGARGHAVTVTSQGTFGDRDFGNKPASEITVNFTALADLPGGTNDATRATSISCVDAANSSVGSNTNMNSLTTSNVFTNQSSVVCTITFVDP